MKNISILGAGNGGQTMAGHFALLGHRVSLYNRTEERIAPIIARKSILLNEAIQGIGHLHRATTNLAEAVTSAQLLMVTTTADAHKELAEKMADWVSDGQIIILNPGRTLGAFEFATVLRRLTQKRIYIAEAQSLVYACRAESVGQVRVIGVKDKVLLAAYPHDDTAHVLHEINSVYSCFFEAKNILETSLENIGAILHPAIILFNAATIERGQNFYFYNDLTPAIAEFIEKLDQERLKIGQAFGVQLKSVSEWVSFAYKNIEGHTLYEKIRNNPAYYKILAPQSLHSRLLLEDIPTGILPLIELGRMARVQTPLMESILTISQTLLKVDFKQQGRTLNNLGLAGLSINDFLQKL